MEDEKKSQIFPVGSKVQLLPKYGEIYENVFGGTTGYVRDLKTDEYGDELILVDWDREDWLYSGQRPRWAFANHFKLKEVPPKKTPRPKRITKKDLEKRAELDAYMLELQKGIEALAGSEGFILFIARREPVPDAPDQTIVTPEIYAASHTSDADAVLGITLAEHVASTFEDMAILLLEMFSDD